MLKDTASVDSRGAAVTSKSLRFGIVGKIEMEIP